MYMTLYGFVNMRYYEFQSKFGYETTDLQSLYHICGSNPHHIFSHKDNDLRFQIDGKNLLLNSNTG